MKKILLLTFVICQLMVLPAFATDIVCKKRCCPPPKPASGIVEVKPVIELAILLDTSGSMSGLIDQAREEIWSIINELTYARHCGVRPDLSIALYEYGKSTVSAREGYIRCISTFTKDLDKISEELFKLRTNGGSEHCGQVIKAAVEGLPWSRCGNALKIIFIAGNEPFTQGPVDYRDACRAAISRGIIVNTIHCGDERVGIDTNWRDGATLAEGKYLYINHNQGAIHISTPQDDEIARLGGLLNSTYVSYGRKGGLFSRRQMAQDMNAESLSPNARLNRSVSKASSYYDNSSWDMVDAVEEDKEILVKIKKKDLPKEMRGMSEKEMAKHIEKKAAQRKEIQDKINTLNRVRLDYIAKQKKLNAGMDNTLGSAMIEAIRVQAKKKNFTFEATDK